MVDDRPENDDPQLTRFALLFGVVMAFICVAAALARSLWLGYHDPYIVLPLAFAAFILAVTFTVRND